MAYYDDPDDDDRDFQGVEDTLDWMFPDGIDDGFWTHD